MIISNVLIATRFIGGVISAVVALISLAIGVASAEEPCNGLVVFGGFLGAWIFGYSAWFLCQ